MRGGHLSDKCGTLVSGTAPLLFDGAEKTRLLCTPYVDLSSGGNLRFTIKHGRCKLKPCSHVTSVFAFLLSNANVKYEHHHLLP